MKHFCITTLALALVACGGGNEEPAKAPAPTTTTSLTLASDPGPAVSVAAAREMGSGDEVVVTGRIRNLVKGFASFQLIDATLDYCGTGGDEMEDCKTPWDYCCTANDVQSANMLVVEADGSDGKVLKMASIPGLRLLDLVKVKGKVTRDEHENVTVHASGWFVSERPDLPGDLRWPE